MQKFNSYWPIYKNLEEETLQLTKYINFSDDQLKVYSMHIADLIMRIAVEIESISKELYKNIGGPDVFDENGNPRDLFFDTDCIDYLNDKWKICNRDVIVSCTCFNFKDKLLKPLKKANKRGTSSSKWNKAYQAVKHDRRSNLAKGNIENLIHALGALYILNIYYKDEAFDYRTNTFDNRLGSDVFAVSLADASKTSIGVDASDNAIENQEKERITSSLYIIKYKDESWKKMHEEVIKYNHKIIEDLGRNPVLLEKLNKRTVNSNDLATNFLILIDEMRDDYIRKNPPMDFGKAFMNAEKEVVLNKGQTIYKINS